MNKITATLPAPTFDDWFLDFSTDLLKISKTTTAENIGTWHKLYTEFWRRGYTPEHAAQLILLSE